MSTGISLLEHLERVPDPRVKRTQRHELIDILVIALCAAIGGADDWVGVVEFGKAKREWFSTFLKLPNGVASHDTFGRVFQILDSQVLERVCIEWLQSIAGQIEGVVAIDGKSLRGSRSGKQSPLHIVSAWACQNSMLLGQVQTDKKSNEITAIPELLKLLSIPSPITLTCTGKLPRGFEKTKKPTLTNKRTVSAWRTHRPTITVASKAENTGSWKCQSI